MSKQKTVAIIGTGPLGIASASLLSERGYKVIPIDHKLYLNGLEGPPAYILHFDGIEYLLKGNPSTGYHCVDGGVALQLFYGTNLMTTDVSHRHNRTRFFLSDESAKKIAVGDFVENAFLMQGRYKRNYDYLKSVYNWDDQTANKALHGSPDQFVRVLAQNSYPDVKNVACGVAGSGLGLHFERYSSLAQKLLERHDIAGAYNANVTGIYKARDQYHVQIHGGALIAADYVLLSAGVGNPSLVHKTDGAQDAPSGYYFLNCMAKINLPALSGKNLSALEKIKLSHYLNKINFTLQGPEAGASFVCVKPPTGNENGHAVSYVPNMRATQIEEYAFDFKSGGSKPPEHFSKIMENGLPREQELPRKKVVLESLCHYYPFLKDYIRLEDISFRYGVVYSPHGKGETRNQREVVPVTKVTTDGQVLAAHASKFTTHVLHAYEVLDYILKRDRGEELPRSRDNGFGPGNFDLPNLIRNINGPEMVGYYRSRETERMAVKWARESVLA